MMNEAYFVKNLNNQKDVEAIRKTCIQLREATKTSFCVSLFESLCIKLRELTSVGKNPPTQILFEEGVINILIDLLQGMLLGNYTTARETLWIMINVLANIDTDKLNIIKKSEFPERLVKIMMIDNPEIIENVTTIINLGHLVLLQSR